MTPAQLTALADVHAEATDPSGKRKRPKPAAAADLMRLAALTGGG